MRRALGLLTIAATLTACGAPVPQPQAAVVLVDYAVGAPATLPAGEVVLHLRNDGLIHHDLTICPGERDACAGEPMPLRVLRKPAQAREPDLVPDETLSLVVGADWDLLVGADLPAGRYRFYCAIVNHPARGMATVVDVG
jgi:hypothetical protein